MKSASNGWWRLDKPPMEHGMDYTFIPDGEIHLPDPRSPWQPEGVHGPSRTVDHSKFEWTDSCWQAPPLSSAVIYELHTGTFSPEGTFYGAINRMDHLVNLGITHVELMPVSEFSGNRGWGYDSVDLYAPHHIYGGPHGLKCLVNACHERGLAVILDVVYNHLGPEGNYLGRFGPYFTSHYKTPWGEAVNLDGPDSPEVRRFFIDNALMWLRDYHIDGLRLDAVHAIIDISAIHFFEQLAAEVKELGTHLGRHFFLIVENDLNNTQMIRSQEAGGYGIDAQWNEDFHHALHAVLTGEKNGYYMDFGSIGDLARVLTGGLVYDGRYSAYRRRIHGRPATGVSGHRFVGCLQNHDQVGNRALGERSSHLMSPGLIMIGAALVLTSPFIPMIFQGEEWAASTPFLYFTDHQDPALGEAVKNGRRSEFSDFDWKPETIPDPQEEETFLRSRLEWKELTDPFHDRMLDWYRSLIRVRFLLTDLNNGRMDLIRITFDEQARWFTMARGSSLIACNFATESQAVQCPGLEGKRIVLASEKGIMPEHNRILLPGESVAILTVENLPAPGI